MQNDQNNQQYECLQNTFINIFSKEAKVLLITTTLLFCAVASSQGILLSQLDAKGSLPRLCLSSFLSFLILFLFLLLSRFLFFSRWASFLTKLNSNHVRPFVSALFLFAAICFPVFGAIVFFFMPFVLNSIFTRNRGKALDQLRKACSLTAALGGVLILCCFCPEPIKSLAEYCPVVSTFSVLFCLVWNLGMSKSEENWVQYLYCPVATVIIAVVYLIFPAICILCPEHFWKCYALATFVPFVYGGLRLLWIKFIEKPRFHTVNVNRSLSEKIRGSQGISETSCPAADVIRISDGYYRIFSLRYFNPDCARQGEGGYHACLDNREGIFPQNNCVWYVFLNTGSGDSPLLPSPDSTSQNFQKFFDVLAREASEVFLQKDSSQNTSDDLDKLLRRRFLLKWSAGASVMWTKAPWESAEALGIPESSVCNLFYPPGCGIVDKNGFYCKASLTITISLKDTVKEAFDRVSAPCGTTVDSDDVKLLRRFLVCYPLILPSIYSSLWQEIIKRAKEKTCLNVDLQDASSTREQTIFDTDEDLTSKLEPQYIAEFVSLKVTSSPFEQGVLNSERYNEYLQLYVTERTISDQKFGALWNLDELFRANYRAMQKQIKDSINNVINKLNNSRVEGTEAVKEALATRQAYEQGPARTEVDRISKSLEEETNELKDMLQDRADKIGQAYGRERNYEAANRDVWHSKSSVGLTKGE